MKDTTDVLDLLACPFCGCDCAEFKSFGWTNYVTCVNCGGRTRSENTEVSAKEKWNSRAQPNVAVMCEDGWPHSWDVNKDIAVDGNNHRRCNVCGLSGYFDGEKTGKDCLKKPTKDFDEPASRNS